MDTTDLTLHGADRHWSTGHPQIVASNPAGQRLAIPTTRAGLLRLIQDAAGVLAALDQEATTR